MSRLRNVHGDASFPMLPLKIAAMDALLMTVKDCRHTCSRRWFSAFDGGCAPNRKGLLE